jgi:hypothetical protein
MASASLYFLTPGVQTPVAAGLTATLVAYGTTTPTIATGTTDVNGQVTFTGLTLPGMFTATLTGSGAPTNPFNFLIDAYGNVLEAPVFSGTPIAWDASGVAPPSFTTRSVGTKVVLYPNLSSTFADYALGIDAGTMWFSVPQASSIEKFAWFGGTTLIGYATADGTNLVWGVANKCQFGFNNTGTAVAGVSPSLLGLAVPSVAWYFAFDNAGSLGVTGGVSMALGLRAGGTGISKTLLDGYIRVQPGGANELAVLEIQGGPQSGGTTYAWQLFTGNSAGVWGNGFTFWNSAQSGRVLGINPVGTVYTTAACYNVAPSFEWIDSTGGYTGIGAGAANQTQGISGSLVDINGNSSVLAVCDAAGNWGFRNVLRWGQNSQGVYAASAGICYGDLTVNRGLQASGGGAAGAIYFSNAGPDYVFYDGANWIINSHTSAGNFTVAETNALKVTAGSWAAISDARAKKNIRDHTHGMDVLRKIRPRTFRYNGVVHEDDGKDHVGLIAQEAKEAHPPLVFTMPDSSDANGQPLKSNGMLHFDPSELLYVLINAVKELDVRVTALKG